MQWGKTAYFACLEAPSCLVIEFGKDKVPAYEGGEQKGTEKCDLCIE